MVADAKILEFYYLVSAEVGGGFEDGFKSGRRLLDLLLDPEHLTDVLALDPFAVGEIVH